VELICETCYEVQSSRGHLPSVVDAVLTLRQKTLHLRQKQACHAPATGQ
jgi:hypothetical protein